MNLLNTTLWNIRICTIGKANRVLETEWSLSRAKLDAFDAVLYEAKFLFCRLSVLIKKKRADLTLMEPFTGCERTVTTDNIFTSSSLAKKIQAKETTKI